MGNIFQNLWITYDTMFQIGIESTPCLTQLEKMKRDEAALRAELTQKLSNQQVLFLVANNNSALIFPLLLMMLLKMPLLTM